MGLKTHHGTRNGDKKPACELDIKAPVIQNTCSVLLSRVSSIYAAKTGRDEKVKMKPKNQNFLLTPRVKGLEMVLETGLRNKFGPYMAPGGQY